MTTPLIVKLSYTIDSGSLDDLQIVGDIRRIGTSGATLAHLVLRAAHREQQFLLDPGTYKLRFNIGRVSEGAAGSFSLTAEFQGTDSATTASFKPAEGLVTRIFDFEVPAP